MYHKLAPIISLFLLMLCVGGYPIWKCVKDKHCLDWCLNFPPPEGVNWWYPAWELGWCRCLIFKQNHVFDGAFP